MANDKNANLGFDQSTPDSDTVANTETETKIFDLTRPFFAVRVSIDDCTNVDSSTTMSFEVDWDEAGDLYELWDINGQSQLATGTLPTDTSAISFLLRDAVGIRRLKCVFSTAVTGDVVVRVVGIEGGIERTP